MINRQLLLECLLRAPDPTSVIRFVDNMNKVAAQVETVDQATLPEQVHASYRIKANAIQKNTWLRWTLIGDVDNGPPGVVNMTLRVRWGGLTGAVMVSAVKPAPSSTGTNSPWRAAVDIVCAGQPGPACNLATWLSLFWQPVPDATSFYGSANFDTTVDQTLVFTVQFDAVTGNPHFRTLAWSLEDF